MHSPSPRKPQTVTSSPAGSRGFDSPVSQSAPLLEICPCRDPHPPRTPPCPGAPPARHTTEGDQPPRLSGVTARPLEKPQDESRSKSLRQTQTECWDCRETQPLLPGKCARARLTRAAANPPQLFLTEETKSPGGKDRSSRPTASVHPDTRVCSVHKRPWCGSGLSIPWTRCLVLP